MHCTSHLFPATHITLRRLISLWLLLQVPAALGAGAIPPPANSATNGFETEHMYICMLYAPDKSGVNGLTRYLQKLGARGKGALWTYTNPLLKQTTVIHVVVDFAGIKQALYTEDAHVIINGHSNFGLGGVFANAQELRAQKIKTIYYMDDDRLLTWSSPWIAVNVPRIRGHQSYPNWWPVFKDGTSAIMPLDFDDPRGTPPFNYCLTYQLPGDSTCYKIETVQNSALERFPGCDKPAWYSPDGIAPDPANPDHLQYFLTNTNKAFESVGIWVGTSSARGYYGQDYLYAPAGKGLNQVGWFFSIPAAGDYTLSTLWPGGTRNTSEAFFTVAHAAGTTTVKKNQRLNGGKWSKLGVFAFDAGEYAVVLTDNSSSSQTFVVADAIRITSAANPDAFDQVVDNGLCPAPHFGKKTILFRRELEIDPDQLRYKRLFYESCYSGPYYLDTFHRGLTFYTVNNSDMRSFQTYLRTYLRGGSDAEVWAAIQRLEPVYDYYDFTKSPADQLKGQAPSHLMLAAPSAKEEAQTRQLGEAAADQALDALKSDAFIHDAALSRRAALGAFGHRKTEGIALALNQMTSPVLAGSGVARSRVPDFVAAKRILEAFPEESVPALRTLYGRSAALARGNIIRASGEVPGGDAVRDLLVGALEDKNSCEEASLESDGEPLRVCDVAYNQLVLRYRVENVLRTIGPTHRMAIRDYHISVLKTRL